MAAPGRIVSQFLGPGGDDLDARSKVELANRPSEEIRGTAAGIEQSQAVTRPGGSNDQPRQTPSRTQVEHAPVASLLAQQLEKRQGVGDLGIEGRAADQRPSPGLRQHRRERSDYRLVVLSAPELGPGSALS